MPFINEAFVKQFSDNILIQLQQKGSRFRGRVREEVLKGEEGYFDMIHAVATAVVPDNFTAGNMHPDTVISDTEWSRRRVTTVYRAWADLIEHRDKARMLVDPTSSYVRAGAWAMSRAIDDTIIEAATGTAYSGHDGTTAVPFPSSQIITDGGTGLTIDKLMQAKEMLDSAEVDEDEPRTIFVTAKAITSLLKDVSDSNLTRDADTVRALVRGDTNTYMGFTFVRTERLQTKTAEDGTSTADICFVASQEGLLFATGPDPVARVTERADKNYAIQVYFGMRMGATRMDEKRVVEIDCVRA